MILSDFLSRQKVDDSKPNEIIPISFNMRDILQDWYYNIKSVKTKDKYMVQTRSQAKAIRVNLPEVHGVNKGLDPYIRPERWTIKPTVIHTGVRTPICKPRVGQGRAGLRREMKIVMPLQLKQIIATAKMHKPETITQPKITSQIEHIPSGQTTHKQPLSPKVMTRQVPPCPKPYLKPPFRPPDFRESWRTLSNLDIYTDINTDFEENSPYQEGIISEIYERPDKSYVKEPPEFGDLLGTSKLV